MIKREPGLYWIKAFEDGIWEGLQWHGKWWSGCKIGYEPAVVGPRIPTPDEQWQTVPVEPTDRESAGFRAMCEAFQRLEEIVGLDTGGGMGPAPALNAVERIVNEHRGMSSWISRNTDQKSLKEWGDIEAERDVLLKVNESWRQDGALSRVIAASQTEVLGKWAEHFRYCQAAGTLKDPAGELEFAVKRLRHQAEEGS